MQSSHIPTREDKVLTAALYGSLLAAVVACRSQSTLSGRVLAIVAAVRGLGVELLRLSLEAQDQPFRKHLVDVPCPRCGILAHKAKSLKPRQRFTLLGKVTYRRCRYRCSPCDASFFPLDEQLDLDPRHRGHSREFVSELVLLCTIIPYEKGCEMFRRLCGVAVSHPLAWKLTFTVGNLLYEREMDEADSLWLDRVADPEQFEPTPHQLRSRDRARRMYVMLDNSKLGMQEGKRGRKAPKRRKHSKKKDDNGWRDARALIIFRDTDIAKNHSGKRGTILNRRVVAHIGTNGDWYKIVHKTFFEEGVYWAHEVVVVADGGNGLWELIEELLPTTDRRRVVHVLDWYHAASHIWDVGRLLKGVDKDSRPTRKCRIWVDGLLDYLQRGEVSNVLQRLRKITGGNRETREALRKLVDYFEKHRNRMRYGWCRKHRMLIGSGAIESAHKWVIQVRCKLPGMRWSLAGANAMLRLRCAWASGRWDDVFRSERAPPPTDAQISRVAA
jgi:hypothetical protein